MEEISSTLCSQMEGFVKPFLGIANAGEGINMKPGGPQMAR